MMQGSNLTGGDCVYTNYAQATGPVSGTNYLFVSNADVDRLVALGMNAFRLVFAWECLQPQPWANPEQNTGNYKTYYDRFKAIVDYITNVKKCTCIVDIHGGSDATFGAYRGVRIGGNLPTGEAVADLFENLYWHLGRIFAGNTRVQWGLTNEPVGMPAGVWFATAQRAINTLRSQGAKQKVWAPGVAYTGAGSWVSSGNAAAWNLTDSANNLGVQVHLYVDPNSGGGTNEIVNEDIAVSRLKVAVDWAKSKGLQVLVGEVAMSAANPIAQKTWDKLAAYMLANASTVAGWMWWATGPASWWGGYRFNLCDTTTGRSNLALIDDTINPIVDVAALQADNKRLTDEVARLTKLVESEREITDAATADNAKLRAIVAAVRAAVA